MFKSIVKTKYSLIVLLVIFLVVSFGILGIAGEVWAQKNAKDCVDAGKIWLQIPIPIKGQMVQCITGFPAYVQAIYNLFIGIVGILAVIMIMVGGFQWLLAAGNMQRIAGAKTTIISAVMGLVLALTSYTILSLINPSLTNLTLTPETLTGTEYEEYAELGFMPCNKSLNIAGNLDHFDCGVTYTYKVGEEERQCVGVYCSDSRKICAQTNYVTVKPSCVDSLQLLYHPELTDPDKGGYGTEWEVWKPGIAQCGTLVYQDKYLLTLSNRQRIGSDCSSGENCYVNAIADIIPLINQNEIIPKEEVEDEEKPVARFEEALCIPEE